MNRLRGVNFGGWLSQIDAIEEKDPDGFAGIDAHMRSFIGQEDFARVSAWGFNHVRLPVDWSYFFGEDGEPSEDRLPVLDRAVQWAAASDLALMLDLHKCPGHTFHDETKAVQRLFTDETCVQKTEKIWRCLAHRYSNNPGVIFELLNEPVAPTAAVWNTLKDRICAAVREEAPDATIVTGSNMWHWPSTFAELTPLPQDNVTYCFHFYEPLLFTHQKAPWMAAEPPFALPRTYPGDYGDGVVRHFDMRMSFGKWDRHRMEDALSPVLRFRDAHRVPIICNEFGTYVQAPRPDQLRWLADFLSVLKQNDIGFSYWNYRNLDFGIFSIDERLHADLPQYDNPDHIDLDLLNLLKQG